MRRRGLERLLNMASRGVIDTVLITHRDKLARFGTELTETTLADHGVTILVLNDAKNMTPQKELVSDMLSLIASFSGRVYGFHAAQLRTTVPMT